MFGKDQQEQNAAMLDMDIQQEEILAFFRDYWQPIVGIAIILLMLTGAVQVYRNWSTETAGIQTAMLLPLANAPPTAASAKALEDFAATKASGSRRALALLFAALKYKAINKSEDVKRVLIAVTNSSAPEDLRNYARILYVNAGGDIKVLDKIGQHSTWRTAIAEIRALMEPNPQKQRDDFAVIAVDPHTPPDMHARAAEFSGQTGAE